MPPMNCIYVPSRLVKVAFTPGASVICSRCHLQATKNSSISFKHQKRCLRTRPHKTSTTVQDTERHSVDGELTLENEVATGVTRPESQKSAVIIDEPHRHSAREDKNDEIFDEEALEEDDQEDDVGVEEAKGYVPATTWHGLRSLEPSEWDRQAHYEGFNSNSTIREHIHVEWAIYCALVEFYTLKQNGYPIDFMFDSHQSKIKKLLITKETAFEYGENGALALKFLDIKKEQAAVSSLVTAIEEDEATTDPLDSDKPIESHIVEKNHLPEEAIVADHETLSPPEEGPKPRNVNGQGPSSKYTSSQEVPSRKSIKRSAKGPPPDRSWLDIPLADPSLKFAILKRTSQILGLRIPDPQVASINDISSLLGVLVQKPKPRKLAKEIKKDMRLQGLKNLKMFGTRWKDDQKDIEMGRAKVIWRELRKRGISPAWFPKHSPAVRKQDA